MVSIPNWTFVHHLVDDAIEPRTQYLLRNV